MLDNVKLPHPQSVRLNSDDLTVLRHRHEESCFIRFNVFHVPCRSYPYYVGTIGKTYRRIGQVLLSPSRIVTLYGYVPLYPVVVQFAPHRTYNRRFLNFLFLFSVAKMLHLFKRTIDFLASPVGRTAMLFSIKHVPGYFVRIPVP